MCYISLYVLFFKSELLLCVQTKRLASRYSQEAVECLKGMRDGEARWDNQLLDITKMQIQIQIQIQMLFPNMNLIYLAK